MKVTITYREALRQSMHLALEENPQAIIIGQGVTDPTRIFGTTANLVETFGQNRVIDTAISEEGITGIAIGAALNGLYPIQTHIRVDFMVLAMNQIINLAAKYKYMFGGSFKVPMLIRAVVGRSWGQGPQHSQSLQALFSHIPGLTVIMPSTANQVLRSYRHALNNFQSPVISIEHRLLYDMSFYEKTENQSEDNAFSARIVQQGDGVTIVATSYMVEEAQKAAKWVKEQEGIQVEIIDLHVVSHVDHNLIFDSVSKTGRLIIADTSWLPYGVCAEVCRGIMGKNPSVLRQPVTQIGMQHTPCPTSHVLEDVFYPDMGTLINAIYTQISGSKSHGMPLPPKEYIRDQYHAFKGPF